MSGWINRYKKNSDTAQFRIICFPFAGGAAQLFRDWSTYLPDEFEVLAMQPPGRWNRMSEGFITSVPQLAESAHADLLGCFDKPFFLFGYSLGARVAFELARLIRKNNGSMPKGLFVASASAPQLPLMHPPINNLPDDQLLKKITELYEDMPPKILEEPELLKIMLNTLRADMRAFETYEYHPEPPLNMAIFSFRGTRDKEVSLERAEAWRSQTSADFEIEQFPGGHLFVKDIEKKFLETIRDKIKHCLR